MLHQFAGGSIARGPRAPTEPQPSSFIVRLVSALMMSMACTLFGLTPEEALAGMTREAARALGLQDEIGTISDGRAADLCLWRVGRPAELCYWIGMPGPERRIVAGLDA